MTLSEELDFGTRVFCQNTRDQFVDYLDDMWASVPEEHLTKVKEAYGEDWLKPYVGMYNTE